MEDDLVKTLQLQSPLWVGVCAPKNGQRPPSFLSTIRPFWWFFFTLCNFGVQWPSEVTTIREVFVCFLMSFFLPFLNSRMMISSEKSISIKVTDMVCHFKILWRFQQPLLTYDFSMWLTSTGLSSISSFDIPIQWSSWKYSGILDRCSIYSLP